MHILWFNDGEEVQGMNWRLSPREKRKYEAAKRLGLTIQLVQNGWAGLSAKDTGRIGAALRREKQE